MPCQAPYVTGADLQGGGSGVGIDSLQAGLWVPAGAPFCAQVGATLSNRASFARFVCPRTMSVSKIAFCVSTVATADDPCDVGIYSGNGQTLLSSAGSTAGKLNAATGVQTLNLQVAVQLVQGQVYYAAFALGAPLGTAAQVVMTNLLSSMCPPFGSGFLTIEQATITPLFPLTAPLGGPFSMGNVPILALQT